MFRKNTPTCISNFLSYFVVHLVDNKETVYLPKLEYNRTAYKKRLSFLLFFQIFPENHVSTKVFVTSLLYQLHNFTSSGYAVDHTGSYILPLTVLGCVATGSSLCLALAYRKCVM